MKVLSPASPGHMAAPLATVTISISVKPISSRSLCIFLSGRVFWDVQKSDGQVELLKVEKLCQALFSTCSNLQENQSPISGNQFHQANCCCKQCGAVWKFLRTKLAPYILFSHLLVLGNDRILICLKLSSAANWFFFPIGSLAFFFESFSKSRARFRAILFCFERKSFHHGCCCCIGIGTERGGGERERVDLISTHLQPTAIFDGNFMDLNA
ncbi:hypothetical protein D917_07471 [Trichinella nativa]|uniref:Uncharacterized protein n=1 Tax=Trichinella nativa TaxID=6335 RepID=A0A1Y3EUM6_9BILA|nr:hypothetical protein D917_07471 [Trichinella nativa]